MLKLFLKSREQLKKDQKGFSLVELVIVIAIMGILAVVLTPKLAHYLEKAKVATDKEIANTMYTAVQMALIDETTWTTVPDAYKATGGQNIISKLYIRVGTTGKYNALADDTTKSDDDYDKLSAFEKEIIKVVGPSFTFKSNDMTAATTPSVNVYVVNQGSFTITVSGGSFSYVLPDDVQ